MTHAPSRGGHLAHRERGLRANASSSRTHRGDTRRAFSLLELTLVLAIIAALMGVAAFALLGQGTAAKITATKASMSVLQTAIGQYQLNHSVYPDTLARLVTVGYVEPKSMEDSFKQPFIYRVPGFSGRPYTLMSGGPDRDASTPGDNIDVWTMAATPGGGQ